MLPCGRWIGEVGHEMRLLGMKMSVVYRRVTARSNRIEATTADSSSKSRDILHPSGKIHPHTTRTVRSTYMLYAFVILPTLEIANRVISCRRIGAWRLR